MKSSVLKDDSRVAGLRALKCRSTMWVASNGKSDADNLQHANNGVARAARHASYDGLSFERNGFLKALLTDETSAFEDAN